MKAEENFRVTICPKLKYIFHCQYLLPPRSEQASLDTGLWQYTDGYSKYSGCPGREAAGPHTLEVHFSTDW